MTEAEIPQEAVAAASSFDVGAMAASVGSFATNTIEFLTNIDWMAHIETLCGWISIAVPFVFPVILVYICYKVGLRLWAFIQTLQVVGAPNEWIVVMRDGKHVRSGVGLNFYRMPWDTIANFPSGVREVQFNAMQVTKEMQGLNVSATLAWTVYREGDGPYNCYKTFGKSIESNNPAATNAKLVALAQSVCRETIANNTIDNIIKNREILTDRIRTTLGPIVKTWGMYLERVDIKDVKICSATLFSNIQAEFRLSQRKDAEIKTITSNNFLTKERLKNSLDDAKRQADSDKNRTRQEIARESERLRKDMQNYKQDIAVQKRTKDRSVKKNIFDQEQQHEANINRQKVDYDYWQAGVMNRVTEMKEQQDKIKSEAELALKKKQDSIELSKKDDSAARDRKTAKYNLTKEIYSDQTLVDYEFLRSQKQIYQRYTGTVDIHQMDGQDPYSSQLQAFVKSATESKKVV